MTQKYFKQTYKTASALVLTIASMAIMTDAVAKPEWAIQLKVYPTCTGCHTKAVGEDDNVMVAARTAYKNGGVVPGLQNFLKPAVVNKFSVSSAKWLANKLTVSGLVIFKKTTTAAAKAAALKTLRLTIKSNAGKSVGTPVPLVVNAKTGAWTKIFALTAVQVPCFVKAEYEGLKTKSLAVKPTSKTCVK